MECRVHSPCGGFTVRFVFSPTTERVERDASQPDSQHQSPLSQGGEGGGKIALQVHAKPDYQGCPLASGEFAATLTPETVAHITADAGVTKTLPKFADMLYAALVGIGPSATALNFNICTLGEAVQRLQSEENSGGPHQGSSSSSSSSPAASPPHQQPAIKKESVLSSSHSHSTEVSAQLILLLEYNVAFTRAWYAVPLSALKGSPPVSGGLLQTPPLNGGRGRDHHQTSSRSYSPHHRNEVVSPTTTGTNVKEVEEEGSMMMPRVVLGASHPTQQQQYQGQQSPQSAQRGQYLNEKENTIHNQGGGGGEKIQQFHKGEDQLLLSEIKRLKRENHALRVGAERELKEVVKHCERLKKDYQDAHRWKDDAHHYKKRCSDLEREVSRLQRTSNSSYGGGGSTPSRRNTTPSRSGSVTERRGYSSSSPSRGGHATPPRQRNPPYTSYGNALSSGGNRYNSSSREPRGSGGGISGTPRGGSPSRHGSATSRGRPVGGGGYNPNNSSSQRNRYDSGDDRSSNGSFGGSRGGSRYNSPSARQNYRVSPTKRSSTPPRGVWR